MDASPSQPLEIHCLFIQSYKIVGPLMNYWNPSYVHLKISCMLLYHLTHHAGPILAPMGLVTLPLVVDLGASMSGVLHMMRLI